MTASESQETIEVNLEQKVNSLAMRNRCATATYKNMESYAAIALSGVWPLGLRTWVW